ncbi:MAG TPA: hypothetical protein VIL20_23510 [Sandaracinaceae bacterium]
MRIEADSVLHHPREAVFDAYRDDMEIFAEYLPNIRRFEVIERTTEGSIVRLHNRWHGATELPAGLAAKLEERFLSWDDYATWDRDAWTCEWVIEPHVLRETVRCRGRTDFVDLGGRTRIELTGELAFELERVKGVPSFLAGSLARTVESFLVRTITANLASMSDALAAHLQDDTIA